MGLLIRNGTVVSSSGARKADLFVDGEKIKAVGQDLAVPPGTECLDAGGKIVIPGVIDVHTHIGLDGGTARAGDDFFTATRAAACGGTTTVIDFATQGAGQTVPEAVDVRRQEAEGLAAIDYSFHPSFTSPGFSDLASVNQLVDAGLPTFKVYMTFKQRGLMIDDGMLYLLMQEVKRNGKCMVGVHAENNDIIERLVAYHLARGHTGPEYHAVTRPNIVEAEAISRAILLAEATGAPLYIYHLSTAEGVRLVREARNRGVRVFAETCPHFLFLSAECYGRPGGQNYIMTPPLRNKGDIDELWNALSDGTVQVVSTDHCSFSSKDKLPGLDDFSRVAAGVPGVQTLLMLVYGCGVRDGRLSLEQMVRVLCENPARLFGLWPEKGTLAPGADADIVLIDPDRTMTIKDQLDMMTDYSPYEGFEIKGVPVLTVARGEVVYRDGVFLGQKGRGRFLPRRVDGNWGNWS